jgi:Ran GTPase-activating protein (RanGAP) involved in mRNA processing and transport
MWQYDWHPPQASSGLARMEGNPRHIFERRPVQLSFAQPYYNPIPVGPGKVINEPIRLTAELRADRGAEVLLHGARRAKEVRRLPQEDKPRIQEAVEREEVQEAERAAKQQQQVRWWQTRDVVDFRDRMKTLKFNNMTFAPEQLLAAREVVVLNLTGCCLGDDQMSWISTFVQQNGTLRRLVLQGNKLTAAGVRNLHAGLASTRSLTDLDLSLNPVGDEGAAALLSSLGENMRHTKVRQLNLSTCGLTENCTYHLARLLREFKSVECLLLWRNSIGVSTNATPEYSGIRLLFDALRGTKTLRLLDLTCNAISEKCAADLATELERAAREVRVAAVDTKHRAARIHAMTDEIAQRKDAAMWDDEAVAVAALERELEAERAKYRAQLEQEAKAKQLKTTASAWRERVLEATGKQLIEPDQPPRLVLRGNSSVSPSTLRRLSAFFDVEMEVDYGEFVRRPRMYDNVIQPRRQVGEPYEFRPVPEDIEARRAWYDVLRFEDPFEREQRLERERRRRELDELRRQGYDGAGKFDQTQVAKREDDGVAISALKAAPRAVPETARRAQRVDPVQAGPEVVIGTSVSPMPSPRSRSADIHVAPVQALPRGARAALARAKAQSRV